MLPENANGYTKYTIFGLIATVLIGGLVIFFISFDNIKSTFEGNELSNIKSVESSQSQSELKKQQTSNSYKNNNKDSDDNGNDEDDDEDEDESETTSLKTIKLNEKILNLNIGDKATLWATVHPINIDDVMVWKSQNESIATVDSIGNVVAKAVGTTEIKFIVNDRYTASCVVNVIGLVSENKTNNDSNNTNTPTSKLNNNNSNKNQNSQKNQNSKPNNNSNNSTSKNSSNGENNKNSNKTTNNAIYPEIVYLNKTNQSIYVGETLKITATIHPSNSSNKQIKWQSSNLDVASVNSKGLVTGKKEGKATITALTHNNRKASIVVTVRQKVAQYIPVTSVKLDKTTGKIKEGQSIKLTASVLPSNATERKISWSSSDTNIAIVDNGIVVGRKAGNVKIVARSQNNKTASADITVESSVVPAGGVAITSPSNSVNVGSSVRLSAVVSPSIATDRSVSWSTNNSSIATIDGTGLLTAKKAGTVIVTAKTHNGKTATTTIVVKNIEVSKVTLNQVVVSMQVGDSYKLIATIQPNNATNKTIAWQSSNNNVVSVSDGNLTAKKAGTATITAKSHNGKTATAAITVKNKPAKVVNATGISLSHTNLTIKRGSTPTIKATVTPSNATNKNVSWSSSDNSVASVSGGKITAKKPGVVTITAKTHNGKTAKAKITVMNFDRSVEKSYGVFLGVDGDDGWNSNKLKQLFKYKLVVIDVQEHFSKADIDKLHKKGIKVYSYLNIGSVENYRSYYKTYKSCLLGKYEGWEDERWVDTGKKAWQDFVINKLEPSIYKKGVDGYFIDNADVYYHYKKDSIYKGLQRILRSVHKRNKPVLMNGGDVFVKKAIADGSYLELFDGVNQEEVFTTNSYKTQSASETKYLKNYLSFLKGKDLKVYLLEYKANSSNLKKIKKYCSDNGFSYHNAKSKNLD